MILQKNVCEKTMMILALESSATACSVALCRDGELVARMEQNSGLTHSRTLLPMVNSLLQTCGVSLEQVDMIAVAAGPGSFTGLRIGVATAKGLAWAGDKDCAPCSTLESMAWPLAHLRGSVIVCAMDARRKQVYNALFLAEGETLCRLTPDRAISLEELGEELKIYQKPKIIVGDGAQLCYNMLKEQQPDLKLAPKHLRMQSAWGVARAAEELAARGALVKGEALTPVYHRLSQAERERLERENQNRT
jgi:tRNA threonylcarbamoyladenosine biosynthesis protein TsaB